MRKEVLRWSNNSGKKGKCQKHLSPRRLAEWLIAAHGKQEKQLIWGKEG
jgi:hypothetical protein